MLKKISIVGLGWLGLATANHLIKSNYKVVGTVTSSEKLMQLVSSPFPVKVIKILNDQIKGDWKMILNDCEYVLINFPPSNNLVEEGAYLKQIGQIIKHTPPNQKVIFISSISVYGDANGLVTEESECHPTRSNGEKVLAAENLLRAHFKSALTIIRFAGLIGPGRHPGNFFKSSSIINNPEAPVNLIHQVDCIQLIEKVIKTNTSGEIYNGCSDHHPSKREFYTAARKNISLEIPQFGNNLNTNSKIIDNQKGKKELNFSYLIANPLQLFEN